MVKDKSGLEASSETVTIQVEGEGIEICDDFESSAIGQQVSGNWQLIPKPNETGGSITVAGDSANKYRKMRIEKVANPSAKDSYFNSPEIRCV